MTKILHRDGWTRPTSAPIHVACETPLHPGQQVFVQARPNEHLRVEHVHTSGGADVPFECHAVVRVHGPDWVRLADGGTLTQARVESGRYLERAPTNRKRKRERCKARRRSRKSLDRYAQAVFDGALDAVKLERMALAGPGPDPGVTFTFDSARERVLREWPPGRGRLPASRSNTPTKA